ncbi:hypothetical protein [Marinicrinis sediminis]|uniref:DUF4760 domain-containing protein n=1 Tax=Marinicrinis sediminis TaxID=1652465 RepID=A0ABW5RBT8_9BACL
MQRQKSIFGILIVFLLLSIIIPFILEYVIFRNQIYSAISNGEWASFLGSFLGGIIGGIGTLVAVYITTLETRRIQEESEVNLEIDRESQRTFNRKKLIDDVAVIVAEFITDISAYYYTNRHNTSGNRSISMKCKYLLQIKLSKIPSSKILLDQINKVYEKDSCSGIEPKAFGDEIEKLLKNLQEFADNYLTKEAS